MTGSRRFGAGSFASLLAVVLVSASCGGGSASPDGSPTGSAGTGAAGTGGGATAVAQCKDVVTTLCTRDNTCNMLNATAANQTACVNDNIVAFGCDRATVSFADCLTDVKGISCASLFTPDGLFIPLSCDPPFNAIPPSTAQDKCFDLAGVICEWIAGCQGITPTPTMLQNCQISVAIDVGCAFAIEVGASYDQCLTDLRQVACPPSADGGASDAGAADGGTVDPPSCKTAITFVN